MREPQQVSNLHPVQVAWLTQGVDYVFADYDLPLLTRLFLLNLVLIFLLFRWHLFLQMMIGMAAYFLVTVNETFAVLAKKMPPPLALYEIVIDVIAR